MGLFDDPHELPRLVGRGKRALRLALSFLTILPVGTLSGDVTEADVSESRYAYPLVGWLLGVSLALSAWLLTKIGVPSGTVAWMIVAMAAVLTGGLHLDGLADSCDGLFLNGDCERRLSAMKDHHIGSFGVVGLILILLGKFAAWKPYRAAIESSG